MFGPNEYPDWKDAHTEARTRANATGLDVAIRKTSGLGKIAFNVAFASVNDSDYALAEIVRPEPKAAQEFTFDAKKYTLRNTGDSSARYGLCEVCGKHCSEVHIQQEYTQYAPGQFTHDDVLMGHAHCLQSVRPKSATKLLQQFKKLKDENATD